MELKQPFVVWLYHPSFKFLPYFIFERYNICVTVQFLQFLPGLLWDSGWVDAFDDVHPFVLIVVFLLEERKQVFS